MTEMNIDARFPTKEEACHALEIIIESGLCTGPILQILDGARIALAEESHNFDLWGKSYEQTNILFDNMRVPYSFDNEEIIQNYQSWLQERLQVENMVRKDVMNG